MTKRAREDETKDFAADKCPKHTDEGPFVRRIVKNAADTACLISSFLNERDLGLFSRTCMDVRTLIKTRPAAWPAYIARQVWRDDPNDCARPLLDFIGPNLRWFQVEIKEKTDSVAPIRFGPGSELFAYAEYIATKCPNIRVVYLDAPTRYNVHLEGKSWPLMAPVMKLIAVNFDDRAARHQPAPFTSDVTKLIVTTTDFRGFCLRASPSITHLVIMSDTVNWNGHNPLQCHCHDGCPQKWTARHPPWDQEDGHVCFPSVTHLKWPLRHDDSTVANRRGDTARDLDLDALFQRKDFPALKMLQLTGEIGSADSLQEQIKIIKANFPGIVIDTSEIQMLSRFYRVLVPFCAEGAFPIPKGFVVPT